jgi:hypothetical protein
MEQALPLLLPGGEWCSPCCFAVLGACCPDVDCCPRSLELLQVAWKKVSSRCCQRGAAGAVQAHAALWGKDGLLLPMLLAESVLQARWSSAGAAVWRAAVLRRKRRATTCRLGRCGVCWRCCPSAVQLGDWCMLSLEKLSFTCMCCIVLEGETFPAAPRQVCNSVHGFWRCKYAFPCASIMVHELL